MHSYLKEILVHKADEVAALYRDERWVKLLAGNKKISGMQKPLQFSERLSTTGLNVIAEVKRKSPSKGILASIQDPVALATAYASSGCAAISVLTDSFGFSGSMDDLRSIASVVDCPVLRKDFIIDQIQLVEAAESGADAVLLIVAVLGKQLKNFLNRCHQLGLEALVEVHTREELRIALDANAEIIGVNNRDLETFEVNTNRAKELILAIPDQVIAVAESGIHDVSTAHAFYELGYQAVLVGEALVTSPRPQDFINALKDIQ